MLRKRKGWSKHWTFGLRQDWLDEYIRNPDCWDVTSALGPKQIMALKTWIKTAGLEDSEGNRGFLFRMFRELGVHDPYPWMFFWVNVVFGFATAEWYVCRVSSGTWSTSMLSNALSSDIGYISRRTACDAIMELVGLLQRTPIGCELGQGTVDTGAHPRLVSRKGMPSLPTDVVRHCLDNLFRREGRTRIAFSEETLWPWRVFGLSEEKGIEAVMRLRDPGFLIDESGVTRLQGG